LAPERDDTRPFRAELVAAALDEHPGQEANSDTGAESRGDYGLWHASTKRSTLSVTIRTRESVLSQTQSG